MNNNEKMICIFFYLEMYLFIRHTFGLVSNANHIKYFITSDQMIYLVIK